MLSEKLLYSNVPHYKAEPAYTMLTEANGCRRGMRAEVGILIKLTAHGLPRKPLIFKLYLPSHLTHNRLR